MNDVCVPAEWLVKLRELAYGQVDIAITADSPPPHTKYIDVDRLRDLVDAVERAPKWSDPLPGEEGYREPLCRCGHSAEFHGSPQDGSVICGLCIEVCKEPPRPSISDEAEAGDNSAERKALSHAAYIFALNHPLYGPATTQAVMDWLNAFKDEHYPYRAARQEEA